MNKTWVTMEDAREYLKKRKAEDAEKKAKAAKNKKVK